ncbi:peroxiredoxin [Jiangella rhizosphaerae]|uniref:thioredoxin-dependent peroxiredoxin n=1 Tax=Jiangella rhizosphaerae TaxID=2293569 RepID=A0A418KXI8_9ACTN|nr:peroxiredoxin [Jiangella rhizosphaerae]RIQ35892.1 peroxiredoxin [Jiangella rhizosphaerae]
MPTRLAPGDVAPVFTLPTAGGGSVSLAGYRGRHVVVYFYPKAMTSGCTTQACDFRDSLASLAAAGYDVVGISPDPLERLAEFAAKERLTFPLASDPSATTLAAWGAYGEKVKDGRTVTGVIRSTVVVGPDGRVELARYDVAADGHVAALRTELGLD